MDDFNKVAEDLLKQKQALQAKYDEARVSAIEHVQQIIRDFKIQVTDLQFAEKTAKKPGVRGPRPIKYKLPTGATWTGQGQMKKEFRDYKNIYFRNLTDAEFLKKFSIEALQEEEKKEEAKEVKPVAKK